MHTLYTLDELKQKSPICLKCFYRAQINSSIFIWKLFNRQWTLFSMKRLLFPKLFRKNKAIITLCGVYRCSGLLLFWSTPSDIFALLLNDTNKNISYRNIETFFNYTCIICYNIISNKKRFFFSKFFSFTSSIFKIDLKHTIYILRKRLQSISI